MVSKRRIIGDSLLISDFLMLPEPRRRRRANRQAPPEFATHFSQPFFLPTK